MTAQIDEVAPDLFRISVYAEAFDLQFNHFLVRDDQPMLFHTGMRRMFEDVYDAVGQLIEPESLRWIGFSHFEVDECGSLNEWLQLAPRAEVLCSQVCAMVNMMDFSDREVRGLKPDEVVSTGKYRFQFVRTPHLPHGWDAGVMFEETQRTLLCSDLCHQNGAVEAVTEAGIMDRVAESIRTFEATPLAGYMPYSAHTHAQIEKLAELRPKTLATMHGSTYVGDGAATLREFDRVLAEIYGPQPE